MPTPPVDRGRMPTIDLSGRVAIVTGASRGIGQATAEALSSAGAAVAITGRREEALTPVAESIEANGGKVLPLAAHSGDRAALEALVEQTVTAFGGLDIVVNNAGTCPHYGPLLDADDALWSKTFEVNLRGPWHLAQAALPHLRARGGGAIINIASVAGLIPQPSVGLYCLTKAGLVMMTKVLGAELAAEGIRVNAVAPGYVRTRFSKGLWQDEPRLEQLMREIPQGRLAEPEEIGAAVLFLASDMCRFASGSTFVIDGGQLVAAGLE